MGVERPADHIVGAQRRLQFPYNTLTLGGVREANEVKAGDHGGRRITDREPIMTDNPLDALPLDLLLALQEAIADPSESGQERAAARAADAGIYMLCTSVPPRAPIPMEEAPESVEGLALRFDG